MSDRSVTVRDAISDPVPSSHKRGDVSFHADSSTLQEIMEGARPGLPPSPDLALAGHVMSSSDRQYAVDISQNAAPTSVTVIIAALNEEDWIAGAIESAFVAGAEEVIVADGGSVDDTSSISRSAGASATTMVGRRACGCRVKEPPHFGFRQRIRSRRPRVRGGRDRGWHPARGCARPPRAAPRPRSPC